MERTATLLPGGEQTGEERQAAGGEGRGWSSAEK